MCKGGVLGNMNFIQRLRAQKATATNSQSQVEHPPPVVQLSYSGGSGSPRRKGSGNRLFVGRTCTGADTDAVRHASFVCSRNDDGGTVIGMGWDGVEEEPVRIPLRRDRQSA